MKFWVASLIFISEFAFAQLDPSSGLLLNSDPRSSNRTSGLDSGRYTVRPHNDSATKKISPAKPPEKNNDKDESEDESSDAAVTQSPAPVLIPIATPTPQVVETKTQAPEVSPKLPDTDVNYQTAKPPSAIDEKKKNIVEISIAPTFIYNHSSSELSLRNYSTSL